MNKSIEKVLIFTMIHGSFVDGYGCRTTIFLKGCPLRCAWCCNPESQSALPEIKNDDTAACTGCGKCAAVCPAGAIEMIPGGEKGPEIRLDREKCTHCGRCAEVCRTGRLETFGKYYTARQVFDTIKRDERSYTATGGGLTIGGGECTMFGGFTLELVRLCKENYINVALDTCGYITDPEGLKAFDEADCVLFDVKGMDPERHRRNTGVDNELILKNLQRRNDLGKSIIIRVPVIPGYNDSPEELDSIARHLSTLRMVERVDIIPFHDYCRVKYRQLGREYPVQATSRAISPEDEEILRERFTRYGLNAQIGG